MSEVTVGAAVPRWRFFTWRVRFVRDTEPDGGGGGIWKPLKASPRRERGEGKRTTAERGDARLFRRTCLTANWFCFIIFLRRRADEDDRFDNDAIKECATLPPGTRRWISRFGTVVFKYRLRWGHSRKRNDGDTQIWELFSSSQRFFLFFHRVQSCDYFDYFANVIIGLVKDNVGFLRWVSVIRNYF